MGAGGNDCSLNFNAGCPEGRDLEFWLRAEQELQNGMQEGVAPAGNSQPGRPTPQTPPSGTQAVKANSSGAAAMAAAASRAS
ncbi:MAG: DUF2934 domain-containing protein, partial [Acidobacteria bacterium]|nr:DUF2934 domain-containing protein [Acidobacteriota bacterium]